MKRNRRFKSGNNHLRTIVVIILALVLGVGCIISELSMSQSGQDWDGETITTQRFINELIPKNVNITEYLDYGNNDIINYEVVNEYCNGIHAFKACSADETMVYYSDMKDAYICYKNVTEDGQDQVCFFKESLSKLNSYTKTLGATFNGSSQFTGTDLSLLKDISQMEVVIEDENSVNYKTSDGICNYSIIVNKVTGYVSYIIYGNEEYTYYVYINPIETMSIEKNNVGYEAAGPEIFVETLFYGLGELYD